MAAARPMAPEMSGVPASNFAGITLYVVRSKVTDAIMSPPPWYGGIASRWAAFP